MIKQDAVGAKAEALKGARGIVHAINRLGQSVIYGVVIFDKFEWIPATALDMVIS
jgi:uncharacterized protein YkvS